MKQAGVLPDYRFELDLHAEVFEACAYHHWGLFESPTRALGTLVLGGGVPKNYNLQPEPALSQVLGLQDISGYQFDVQIVSAPVTDGSLSSCPPAEAVTWGKVDKEHYMRSTESMQADFSMVMPFLVKALLDRRNSSPEPGYRRSPAGYRLFEKRAELCARLEEKVRANGERLTETSRYDLPEAPKP
jgi:deoxyhypusine synthase